MKGKAESPRTITWDEIEGHIPSLVGRKIVDACRMRTIGLHRHWDDGVIFDEPGGMYVRLILDDDSIVITEDGEGYLSQTGIWVNGVTVDNDKTIMKTTDEESIRLRNEFTKLLIKD